MQDADAGDIHQTEKELDTHILKQRSIKGVLALTSRTFILQILALIATFLLTVFLEPSEYGIFFIVSAVVNFLVYFSDIGLAAALIQKKEKLTRADLTTTFFIQQLLVITLVTLALIFADKVNDFYNFGSQASFLFQALVIAFFLSSLKTIPSVLLERELEFNKLVVPQVLENIAFYGVAVFLAWQGNGVNSFTLAVLARGLVGLISIYILKPWLPGFTFSKSAARRLVSFGAPFQLNSLLALIKDDFLIAFLGKILSATEIGYIAWAQKWAMMPLRFFADSILKVTFPVYSRIQHQKELLKTAIEKSIFVVSLLVFPAIIGMISLAPSLINTLPKYTKWEPALLSLAFFGVNAIFSSISITLTNTLNATGKVKTTLKLMVMWTTLTWVLTPVLVNLIGYNGVAIASALTASSSLIAFYLVKKIVNISFLPQVLPALYATSVMFIFLKFSTSIFSTSLPKIAFLVIASSAVYALVILLTSSKKLYSEIASIKKYLVSK